MAFSDKKVLVTGANRGIGQAIAMQFAKMQATVIGTATTAKGADKISSELKQEGFNGIGICLDISSLDSINKAMDEIQKEIGAPDILINNAGITCDNLLLRMKDEEWEKVINTNLTGAYQVTKACLKNMIKSRWGRIIMISSVVGCMGNPGQANYAAAKAGIIGFSKSLAKEIAARNVTVNVVAPGFIDTDMTRALPEKHREELLKMIPANRLGQAEDIANAVTFLASDEASYITGQTLHVNGGMYMS